MTDPWADIARPESEEKLSARRSDEDHPFEFFWAKSYTGQSIFLLEYPEDLNLGSLKLPKLDGLEVLNVSTGTDRRQLQLFLKDKTSSQIFYTLCQDILNETRSCSNEVEAIQRTLIRTWRWHYLLRGGRDDKLSKEQQIGLIGELIFFQEFLLDRFPSVFAVDCWKGPEKSAKDFIIHNVGIECKVVGSSRTTVHISSSHQLDLDQFDELFLSVLKIEPADETSVDGLNLDGLIESISSQITNDESVAMSMFEGKLAEAGYLPDHDYSGSIWTKSDESYYRIDIEFPRLIPNNLPEAIPECAYMISLPSCEDFRIDKAELLEIIKRN